MGDVAVILEKIQYATVFPQPHNFTSLPHEQYTHPPFITVLVQIWELKVPGMDEAA